MLFGEAQARTLTGPASQLAGLFRSYALLSARGWKLLDAGLAQIESGSPASARFARENAPLYIESIYDGHFTLAQIGKKLLAAYGKLGGAGRSARRSRRPKSTRSHASTRGRATGCIRTSARGSALAFRRFRLAHASRLLRRKSERPAWRTTRRK